ncbi:MAG TPA: bifunctional DNA primase/polymerase [Alphaproteobacteria bacterium]|nr:bifunctional DNA primase/polymerase [Alphaproteobacteria bacterium]
MALGPLALSGQKYRSLGLSVIPCGKEDGKTPLVRWSTFSDKLPHDRVIEKWISQFPDANVGIVTGAVSGLTVVDIDKPEKRDQVVAECGHTPLVAKTPRGGYHLYYQHNGEGTRNGVVDGVDLRGRGGFVVAPPSINPKNGGEYTFEIGEASPDILARLPRLNPGFPPPQTSPGNPSQSIPKGQRDDWLFRECMRAAPYCDDLDALLDVARTLNMECDPPLGEWEVVKKAHSAWSYEESGDNNIGHGGQFAKLDVPILELLSGCNGRRKGNACLLLVWLAACHWRLRTEFILAEAMATKIGIGRDAFRGGRDLLVNLRLITCVHPGGKRGPIPDPPIYEFGPAYYEAKGVGKPTTIQ